MVWVLPLNSNLVSGFTILIFNFLLFSAVKSLCQSICASTNLHVIYDLRQPLEPRRSRIGSVFGGPTGPPRLARFFAVLIAIYVLLVIMLDFSVDGATRESLVPTVYRSLVRADENRQPLRIDYEREYVIDDDNRRLASRRLVALAEAHSCLELNITHHSMFAYAYENVTLDKEPIPISTFVYGGECVTSDRFETELRMHTFKQVPELKASCDFNEVITGNMTNTKRMVTADIKRPANCDLKFHAVRCFALSGGERKVHCGAVASKKDKIKPNYLIIVIPDHTKPKLHTAHQLREVDNIPVEDAQVLAANMAFFSAAEFDYGIFNAMYMALSKVEYDVVLNRIVRKNVSEINLAIAAPVLVSVGVSTLLLAVYATLLWVRVVYRKNRRKYTTFSTVEDVLAMVRRDGLTKSKEGDTSDQVIVMQGNRPVLVQEQPWFG